MMLVKLWFLLLAIPATEGSLGLWKPKGSSAEERVTKQILETCYGDNNFKDLIFILGDFNEFIDKTSVIRMKNLLNVDKDYESGQYLSIGVTKVIIIEDSPDKLHSDLISFDKTRWWDHMLPFFIIGKNDEKCENFKEILDITWRMDILNSIYICSQSENTTLYTLNPITNYAPHPWKRMEGLSDSNIYHQVFDPHTSCNNLHYDKTKVLNGYQIKTIVPENLRGEPMEDLVRLLHEKTSAGRLFHRIMRQLNASVKYEQVNLAFSPVHHFEERDVDIVHSLWNITRTFITLTSFTKERNGLVVLVKSNEQTVLYKIRHLWSTQVLCAATIALIILFFILVMKNGGVTSAILDIIRFLTYLSIRTDTRSNSFRIYFTTMLIFIVISNGVFQGKIAAFLTKPDKAAPITTLEELENLGYHFYIPRGYLLPPGLKSLESIVEFAPSVDKCIDYVLNGTLNACIMGLIQYERFYFLKPLDCVKLKSGNPPPSDWKSRRNWPLYERFKGMLTQFIESGISEAGHTEVIKSFYEMRRKRKVDDHDLALEEIVPPYRPIALVELTFVFNLLAIGLLLATFVLIIELKMREIGTN